MASKTWSSTAKNTSTEMLPTERETRQPKKEVISTPRKVRASTVISDILLLNVSYFLI